ncbi:hypothetical protein IWQ49_004441 [Labrenzia sp. EL_126]|nr:hypothetical protein [Labrenzia sp. EL_126]
MRYSLKDFVRESNRIEGIRRNPTDREIFAHAEFLAANTLSVKTFESFVWAVQPNAVLRREKGQNVRVGNHIPPEGGPEIEPALNAFIYCVKEPWKAHCLYEDLHPFTDGNGRSGRVFWLRLMGGIEAAPLGFLHHFYYQTLSQRDAA